MAILYVLNCFDPQGDATAVTLQESDGLTALKKTILAEWGPQARDLAAPDIRLWKPNQNIPLTGGAWARLWQASGHDLKAIATVLDFDDDLQLLVPRTRPKPLVGNVIAEVLPRWQLNATVSPPPHVEQSDERDTIAAMNTRYRNLVDNARNAMPPSSSAESANYREGQRSDHPIYDGRYDPAHDVSTMAPPIQLYNPAFARFSDDVANPGLEIPDSVVVATADLMRKASAIYEEESVRRSKVRPALKNALSYGITQLVDDRTTPDGAVVWTMSGTDGSLDETVALLIEEEQLELGEDGYDASIQASFSMLRYWAQSDNDAVRARCCCPTVLIAFAGPWLAVLGAVLTDKCIVQRLTDFVWLGNGAVLNDSGCRRVARVLYSLTRSLGHLREYYAALASTNNGPDSRFFPSPHSFLAGDVPVRFEYLEALERDSGCVVFRCKTREEQPRAVVVKFAETYCSGAHRLLAANGMAPKLLYCGPVSDHLDAGPAYQALQMIVMDYIDGKTGAQLQLLDPRRLPADFARQLTEIVDVLHGGGYVFGDLRWPNIMVAEDGINEPKVKLIDFDWAGEVGEARYPINISQNVGWPAGVVAMGRIEKAHDLEMLRGVIATSTYA
ncbi:hypothetical protein B0H15DRAFT_56971 [Mycena belliarum]|uniref:Protein kinase domain-containing protein n=1 Tax=Mycena belliarum TaxID=1033014 RepID=A0AAD6UD08_9AGAR|nr:hypothetical protein B0H15DRAFT_56971 [Mycena belliae]